MVDPRFALHEPKSQLIEIPFIVCLCFDEGFEWNEGYRVWLRSKITGQFVDLSPAQQLIYRQVLAKIHRAGIAANEPNELIRPAPNNGRPRVRIREDQG